MLSFTVGDGWIIKQRYKKKTDTIGDTVFTKQ